MGKKNLNLSQVMILWTGYNEGGNLKRSIVQRYIANQYTEQIEEEEHQETYFASHRLPQLFTHTLKLPGRKEIISSTFWEIPSHPLNYMKEQYYANADAVIIGKFTGLCQATSTNIFHCDTMFIRSDATSISTVYSVHSHDEFYFK